MRWPKVLRSLVLAFGPFVSTLAYAQSPTDELGNLPITLSPEGLQQIALLSPASNLQTTGLSQDIRWRQANTKDSVAIFRRQAIWPLRVEMDDGSLYLT